MPQNNNGVPEEPYLNLSDEEDELNGRPSYMKHLFKRHKFHVDIDPWKNNPSAKTQSKTACLSIINEVFKNFTKK